MFVRFAQSTIVPLWLAVFGLAALLGSDVTTGAVLLAVGLAVPAAVLFWRGRIHMQEEHMSAARGDTKPCTRTACSGTMRFGREPLPKRAGTRATDGERGWVCSEQAAHFRRESEQPALTASKSATAGWADDGGAERQVSH
jgi:hypothetical protein